MRFEEIVFPCVKGEAALDVVRSANPEHLKGKTVIDVPNPLDFSRGMPPYLWISNANSPGEEAQKALPGRVP